MSESRGRRRTAKKVDYGKDQEFSDDDVFEDGLNNRTTGTEPTAPQSLAGGSGGGITPNGIQPTTSGTNLPSTTTCTGTPTAGGRRSTGTGNPKRSRKSTTIASNSSPSNDPSSSYPEGVFGLPTAEEFLPQQDKLRYVEKGYDATLLHLRARFTFMPELEADGSTKVEQIVGRRLVEDGGNGVRAGKSNGTATARGSVSGDEDDDDNDDSDNEIASPTTQNRKRKRKPPPSPSSPTTPPPPPKHHGEYEYLIKYKGQSYLHLHWKPAAELESMNRSAKTLYRRFLRKLQSGQGEDDLEDPDVDVSFITPQKIVDVDHHEVFVELTDKELVQFEKERGVDG